MYRIFLANNTHHSLEFGTHASAELLLQWFISVLVLFFLWGRGLWDGKNLKDYLKIYLEVNHCYRKNSEPSTTCISNFIASGFVLS
jgi:hypothetical protein